MKITKLSEQKLEELKKELEHLKTTEMTDVVEAIKAARAFGDLSENSEYDEAKNEQGIVEQEILELEETIKNAKVVDESDLNLDIVSVGLKVRLLNIDDNREMEYRIVGSSESNPAQRMISDESPIGKALIGARLNQVVEIVIPRGVSSYKIIGISK